MKRKLKHILWRIPFVCLMAVAFSLALQACNEEDPEFLTVSHEMVHVDPVAGNQTIEVRSNSSWTATCDCDWLKVVGGSGSLKGTFNIVHNDHTEIAARTTNITVKSRNLTQTITVRQSGVDGALSVSDTQIVFHKEPETHTVTVVSNTAWKVTSSKSWCVISTDTGNGMGQFTISVAENKTGGERDATVSISAEVNGNVIHRTISIIQNANVPTIRVTPTEKVIGSQPDEFVLTVITSATWKATVDCSWLTLDVNETDNTITVTSAENRSGKEQKGIITVYDPNNENGELVTVNITQLATDAQLSVTPETVTFNKDVDSHNIVVTSNRRWSVQCDANWCVPSLTTGENNGAFTITVEENATGQQRMANVVVAINEDGQLVQRIVKVVQKSVPSTIVVTPKHTYMPGSGDDMAISIITNVEWEATSNHAWITIKGDATGTGNSTLPITVGRNTTGKERTGTVTVYTTGLSNDVEVHTVTITQAANDALLSVSDESVLFRKDAGEHTITVNSNRMWNASSSHDWCHIAPVSGVAGTGTFKISVDENTFSYERKATVAVMVIENGAEITKRITVIQKSIPSTITVTPKSLEVNNLEQIRSITVVTDVEWATNTDCGWLTVSRWDQDGTGDEHVEVRIAANNTGETRVGTFTIYTTGLSEERETHTVTVTQTSVASYMEVTPGALNFFKEGGRKNLAVSSNLTSWTAENSDPGRNSWLTVDAGRNNRGNGTIEVRAAENTTGNALTATITVRGTDALGNPFVKDISVTQAAVPATIQVSPENLDLDARDQKFNLNVTTQVKWKITFEDGSWMNTTSNGFTGATGSQAISISVGENKTGKERKATITISTDDLTQEAESHTITVTQSADSYSLTTPVTEYILNKEQQNIEVPFLFSGAANIVVSGDSGAEWITKTTLDPAQPSTVAFAIAENKDGKPRRGTISIFTQGQSGEPIVREVTVWQSPTNERFDVFYPDVNISAMGEVILIPIDANISIEGVRSSTPAPDGWCKVGLENGDVQITAEYNDTGLPRDAIVTVTGTLANGEKIEKAFKVYQEYIDLPFEFPASEYMFKYQGETKSITLTAVGGWELTNTDLPDWITVAPTSGSGTTPISVTAKKNSFIQERMVDLVFQNTNKTKTAILTIKQEKNPSSAIDDYKYLGKGYDVNGDYAKDEFVRAQILDWNKLDAIQAIADINTASSTEERKIYAKEFKEYQSELSSYAKVSGGYAGFSASVEASFSTASLESSENEYASFRHITKKQSVYLHANLTANDLKDCMTAEAEAEINAATTNAQFEALIKKYGTHIITGFVLGGSLDYSMSADTYGMSTSVNWGLAVEAGYKSVSANVSVSAGFSQYEAMKNESMNFEEQLLARGGSSQYASGKGDQAAYNAWLASLDEPARWVMVDYTGSMLIPIWEFMTNGSEADFETFVKNYLNSGLTYTQQSTHMKFKASLINVAHGVDDAGSTAELYWSITFKANSNQASFTGQQQDVPDNSWTGRDVTGKGNLIEVELSKLRSNVLTVSVSGYEDDGTGDDNFSMNFTVTYDTAKQKWFYNSADVTNGTFKVRDAGTEFTFRIDWKAL